MDIEEEPEPEEQSQTCEYPIDEFLPEILSENFLEELNDKINQLIEHLEKCDENISANLVQKLQKVCIKLKNDLTVSEANNAKLQEDEKSTQIKLNELLQITKTDQEIIQSLRKKIENAWKQTDAAQARELAAQDDLKKFKEKLEKLEEEAKKIEPKTEEFTEEGGKSIIAFKENMLRDRDKLTSEVKELNRKLKIQHMYSVELETICSNLEQKNKGLYKLLDTASLEVLKEKKQVDELMKELIVVREAQMVAECTKKELKDNNERYLKMNVQLSMQLLAWKSRFKELKTKYTNVSNKLTKVTVDSELLMDNQNKFQLELSQKIQLVKTKDEENAKLKQDLTNLSKSNEALLKKLAIAQQIKSRVDGEVLRLKNNIIVQEKEMITIKKSIDNYIDKITELIKERETAKKETVQAKRQADLAREKYNNAAKENESLRGMIEKHILDEKNQKRQMVIAKKEIGQQTEKIQTLEEKIDTLKKELFCERDIITELKKNENELLTKLANTQNLVESIRSEKNFLQKNLTSVIKEKEVLKEKLTISSTSVEALKNEIISKTAEYKKLQFHCDKIDEDKSRLKKELENCQVILQNIRSELQEKRMEIENLYKTLVADDDKIKKLKKELDEVQYAKGLLGGQLFKQSEEIEKLFNQLRLARNELDQANALYDRKLEDIRILKIEVRNLRSEQEILRKDREHGAKSRRELLRLHRLLNQERVKARALQDEMLTPMNIHRWNSLRGKDPEKLELITKVQNLQRQILFHNTHSIKRENTLKQVENMYLSLKEFMLKLPSFKVKEELNEVKHELETKEKKMKALIAELNAKQMDDKTKDCILDDLRSNLDTTRRELNKERKMKQKLLDEKHVLTHMQMQYLSASPAYIKTAGAGFKMPSTG